MILHLLALSFVISLSLGAIINKAEQKPARTHQDIIFKDCHHGLPTQKGEYLIMVCREFKGERTYHICKADYVYGLVAWRVKCPNSIPKGGTLRVDGWIEDTNYTEDKE